MKSSNSRSDRQTPSSTIKNTRGYMNKANTTLTFIRRRSLSIGVILILVAAFAYLAPWSKGFALFAPNPPAVLTPQLTTIISPAGDGGFETGVDMTANGWTVVNNATNGWFAGTATFSAGTQSAYISNTAGATYAYNNATASVSHFYRDVTVPAGENGILLSFKLKGDGDLFSGTFFDKMMVYTAPTSFTPTTAAPASSGTALAGATLVYAQAANFGAAYTAQSVLLPASLAGTTFRLIFTFHCDTSTGAVPSSVDEISLTSQILTPLTGTKTIPGDYANFTAAIGDLNLNGVGAGGVTFNVAAGSTFPEETPCVTANGTAANPIIFQKNGGGANPVVQPTGGAGTADFGLCITGSDWVTFDGIDVSIATGSAVEYGYLVRNVAATNGAQNNTIKNVAVTLNRANTASIGILQTNQALGGGITPTSTTGGNSFNKYYNLNIQNVYSGLYLSTLVLGFDTNNEVGVTGGGTTIIGGATASDIGGGAVTTWGIRAIAQQNAKIFKTEVRNVGVTGAVVVDGIFLDQVGGTTDCFQNQVHDIRNTSTTAINVIAGIRSNTFNTVGPINRVYNNFVWNITSGYTGAASASRQIKGISVQSNGTGVGATQMIDFNSVRIDGTASPNISSTALVIGTTSGATMNIRNNILANFTGAQAGIAKHYAWDSTSATLTGIAGSISDHNVLYSPNTNGFVGIGNATDRATLADWRTATGQDTRSKGTDPIYVSATDLHIGAGATEVESGGSFFNGAITWVSVDYDGATRDLNFPDIGADEGTFTAAADTGAPDIFFTPAANSTNTVSRTLTAKIVDPSGVPTAGAGLPVLYFRKGAVGAFTPATGVSTGSGNYDFTITYAAVGGVVIGDVIQYYIVAQDTVGNVGSNPTLGATGFTASPPVAGTAPTTPFSYTIAAAFTGSINVGTTETITSLTNASGLFAQINAGVLTGNLVISLTSDLAVETGANVLNPPVEEPAGSNFTITIKPSGAARVISGTGPAAGALIKLNGVDRVTFDGSTSGGTDRSLTITNNANLTSTAAIWVASLGSNGAQNNTIKNCVINAGADQSTGTLFTFGIISTSSAAILTGGTASNNNTYSNNLIKKASVGIATLGGSSAAPYTGTVISGNQVGPAAFGSDEIGTAGILIFNEDGIQIVDNEVRFVGDANFPSLGGGSRDRVGIVIGSTGASWSLTSGGTSVLVSNANVSRNRIHDIVESTTFSAVGIVDNANNIGVATNNTIVNNMIWNVRANGTSPDQGVGIGVSNGLGDKIVYNSIYMTGDIDPGTQTSATISSFGMSINTALPTNLTLHDNISFMDVSSNTVGLLHSAINIPAAGYAWGTGGSNRNDLVALGANPQAQVGTIGSSGGTYYATLALWQGASGQDANSISADPLFTSPTDLHVAAGSPVVNAGSTIAGVANDFDNDFRPGGTAAEIGADELADAVAPDTTLGTTPTNPSASTSATFTFSGTDSRPGVAPEVVTSFECKLDAAAFATCTSPVNLTLLSEGSHTFQVRAKDGSGNVDPTPASFTWLTDYTEPDTSITSNPTNPTTSTSATFSFTGNDGAGSGVAGFQCKLDAGNFAACTSPTTLLGLSDGSHTYQVQAIDNVGRLDSTPASYTWVIDTLAPDTQILTNPTDPTTNTTATFTFSGSDSVIATVASFECKLDAGSFAACTSPQTYMGLGLGPHNFQVRAIDTAGNVDATPASFSWTITVGGPVGPVSVTATAGTPGPTDYPTVKDAFDAINAGTHQGAITVSIITSTTEAAAAVLNSNGAGSALYASVLIRPAADGLSISGASATGRGVIELNGADNVTIDGDNPNTAGINRNLTITNTAAAATTFTSVIRVALSTLITTGDNNSVKNCIINGSATAQNTAAITGTATAVHTTYGILVGGGASTVSATTAPSAIASVATVVAAPITAANFNSSNNAIDAAARGIAVMGSAVTVANNLSITNNVIGNASAASTTTVYSRGITVQGFDNTTIAGNTVQNVQSFVGTSIMGIGLGNESASGQNALVDRNIVNNVNARSLTTFGSYGINLAAGPSITVRNNFVTGITGDMSGGAAFSTTFGLFGIRVGSGNTHKIYHNSVNMFGARVGTPASSLLGACLAIVVNTQNGIDVRNNILVNTLTGGTTSVAYVSAYLPTTGTAAGMNLTWNNNDYQSGATVGVHGVAHVGTTYTAVPAGPAGWAGLYTIAAFDPTLTTPNANFRAYTSSLSAATTNDNASQKVDPLFVSPTDLHIAVASPMVDAGAAVGVLKDIDLQLRVPPPDIGADEPSGITPPANDIAANAIVTPANGSVVLTGTVLSPQASFTNVGSATQTNVNVQFTITGPGGYNYTNSQSIAAITPEETVIVTFAAAPAFALTGPYVTGAAVTTADSNAANDVIAGGFTVSSPLSGTYTVGSGGNFPSLTNPGGIFEAINSLGATGNITIDITSDLTGENGGVALNQIAGGFTVLIKPSGGPRSITGSSTVGIIRLNGADGVTINGSTTGALADSDDSADVVGGNPALRELTVNNSNAAATAGAVIVVMSGASGAQNDTIKNVNIAGFSPTATLIGIALGGATPGAAGTDNDNNRVENCSFQKAFIGIYNVGASAANPNTGTVITQNDLSATGANRLRRAGILVFNENGIQITENSIGGITSDEGLDAYGIGVGIQDVNTTAATSGGVSNALIARNKINGVTSTSTTGFSASGIAIAGDLAGPNTISNNMISGVSSPATSPDFTDGIFVAGVTNSVTRLYHNSISMTGDRSIVGSSASMLGSYGIAISGTNPTVELKNNIFYTTQIASTGGANAKSYSIGMASATFTNLNSNFNDFFASGANAGFFRTASLAATGTDFATLALWTGATTQDAASFSVDPLYVDPLSNLHLQAASTMINAATTGTGVVDDIDLDTRPFGPASDIGADEVVAGGSGVLQFSAPTYTIGEAGVNASITVTRTGGSGTIGVSYATVAGGSATGGAACGGTVDYVNTSGTLSFPDANSQSFNIPICSDTLDEANETVNLALSLPTGGATIGAQGTSVLTITDDDATPSLAIASPSPQAQAETNAGSHQVTFNVNLSAASGQTVTVHYQTNDGTATTANNDYVGIPDTVLTFNPGETSKPINVTVNGDINPEPDESFTVDLSTPVNATIGTSSASATILNDDGALPTFSINDVRTKESNAGTHTVTFTVSMFSPGAPPGFASVQYATGGGTATPGSVDPADYMSASGTLIFGAADAKATPEGGSTQTRTFTVTIIGDVNKEPNETFFVTLSNPVNGAIGDGTGSCIITDEDRAYVADFDRDLKTDLSVFRPIGQFVDGIWYINQSTNGVTTFEPFGANGDKIVPGDYDSDGVTDFAVFRPSTAIWYIRRSSDFAVVAVQWGQGTDLPVQGDYDGDDKTDIAVFRPSSGTWYVLRSSDSQLQAFQWGASGDKVVPGDYDGDGKNDFAVFRPSAGTWFVQPNTDVSSSSTNWGQTGDIPVAGDFDGDGKADVAVFRPSDGNWYISTSLKGTPIILHWGQGGDIPVVGDYDADGISDIAVWRPSTGDWYILGSNDPAPPLAPDAVLPIFGHWGQTGDKPVPAAYVPEQ